MEGVFLLALFIYVLWYTYFDMRALYMTKQFYEHQLGVDENDIYFGVKDWGHIAAKLKAWQLRSKDNRLNPCGHKQVVLDELAIAQCIMREENYIVALAGTALLDLPLLNTTTVYCTEILVIAGVLSWGKHKLAFGDGGEARAAVVRRTRITLFISGVLLLLCAPVALAWRLMYSVFRYGFALRTEPGRVATRTWSVRALLEFREFNELHHSFELRMANSLRVAQNYVNQYPTHLERILVLSFTFIMTGLIGFIIILSFVNDGALGHVDVFDKPLIWWLSVLTVAVLTAGKLTTKGENGDEAAEMFDPVVGFRKISSCTHWKPAGWSNRSLHLQVFRDFKAKYFPYYVAYVLREAAAVVTSPMHLMFHLNARVDAVAEMMEKCTETLPGVGDVVGFSTFAFNKYGSPLYGTAAAPSAAPAMEYCRAGKMEKSFLTFYSMQAEGYVPPPGAQALLENIDGQRNLNLSATASLLRTHTPLTPPERPLGAAAAAGSTLGHLPSQQMELMTSWYHALEDVHQKKVLERRHGTLPPS
eukprot:TRINITY_DN18211_c0_g1_i1.p2 TRINITY_DN18211_c0_g1~~TRINITY_DN18211_c0_g1_i1.p2  ORF type:complete len:532 (+),score=223.12 TRINITY_DN18211_c0_g1_i1:494-2089(+)